MSQVYITNASANLIFKGLKKVQDKVSKETILKELEEDYTGFVRLDIEQKGGLGRYYNLRELRELYKMKMIFKDLPGLIEDMKSNGNIIAQYIASENNRFTHKVKAPAYHNEKECQWLNAGFKNIELPWSVTDENLREKMKHFVSAFKGKNFQEINVLFQEKFQIEENLREVSLANSGVESVENMEIVTRIKSIFDGMYAALHSGENNTVNKKVNYIVYADTWKQKEICKNPSYSEAERQDIERFFQKKKELTDTLYTFYRQKYNQDLSFEGHLLDSIGFRACRSCTQQNAQFAA